MKWCKIQWYANILQHRFNWIQHRERIFNIRIYSPTRVQESPFISMLSSPVTNEPVECSNQVFLVFDEPWLFHNSWGRQTKQIILKQEMQEDFTWGTPGPNIWLSKFGSVVARWLKFMIYIESCPHPGLSSSLFWTPVLPPIKAKFAENIILCIYLKHFFLWEELENHLPCE